LLGATQIRQKYLKYFIFTLSFLIFILGWVSALGIQEIERNKETFIANIIKKDTQRFIAHAGGGIEGYIYTNSLEALNLSYKKGFRLFELDIIKTSDGTFVAAHDWKSWSRYTGYSGNLPPSKDVFLSHKIHGKFTPIDIDAINSWFTNHPSAVLVTDKVNLPLEFSKKFLYKDRLMMELFTWDAVKKGIDLKIKSSMPTGNLLFKINGNKVSFLKKLGITDIAISRRVINDNSALINSIVKSGINLFAFYLNFDSGKNEKYVICNESQYFYGIYADKWDFDVAINCSSYQ
jgi:glycerophosphoryl diester phosphodiesterase